MAESAIFFNERKYILNMINTVKTLSEDPLVLIVMTIGLSSHIDDKISNFRSVNLELFCNSLTIKTPVIISLKMNKNLPKLGHHSFGTKNHDNKGVYLYVSLVYGDSPW